MLTIDWKERLNKDTADYLSTKLPKKDYDFEIIFIAYPERVNGKIPNEVIVHVANVIVRTLGKKHEEYINFYKALWKKSDYGKLAYTQIMAKLVAKKPAVYIPMLESAMRESTYQEINQILEKVMLPLLRKHPDKYMSHVLGWTKDEYEPLRRQAINTLVKLIKRLPELVAPVLSHFQHLWYYPLGDDLADHIILLKAVGKLDLELYLKTVLDFEQNRDPQIVELVCSSITEHDPKLEQMIENWTKSGNARVKKHAVAAHKLLLRKKKA